MSGFESAIRGAISRAPDGRPETRERIYAAARASLDRSLARIGGSGGDAKRAALEQTIERIEGEWQARAARARATPRPPHASEPSPPEPLQPSGPLQPSKTPRPPGPSLPSEPPGAADAASQPRSERDGTPRLEASGPLSTSDDANRLEPMVSSPAMERKEPSTTGPKVAPTPSDPSATSPPSASAFTTEEPAPSGTGPSPEVRPSPVAVSRDPQPLPIAAPMPTPDAKATSTALDPALVAQLARRDGLATSRPTDDEPVPTAPSAPSVDVLSPAAAAETDAALVAERAVPTSGSADAPSVEADAPVEASPARRRKRAKGGKARDAGKPDRAGRRTAKPKASSRGRNIARLVSLALLVGVGVLGYRWLETAGMLVPGEREVVTITRVDRPPEVAGDERPWTALMTRELSGAVEPLPGEEALRVNGRAEVALDAAALSALGPEISVSLLVRAVGTPGEAAVSCDFAGGGCGRVRFPLPREAEERVLAATIGEGDEARLVLDASISGTPAPFDLLGVTARAR